LSADGNTLAVGGNNYNGGQGATWIYTRSGSNWNTTGTRLTDTTATSAMQGTSVSLSADGSTLAVGGPGNNTGLGTTWIYATNGGFTYTQQAKLVGTGNTGYSNQGQSVSLSKDGNTLAVGGPHDNNNIGATWIFVRYSDQTWVQQGNPLVGYGYVLNPTVYQGYSVSLSADGNTLAVGGPADNSNIGAIWIFHRVDASWIQQGLKLVGNGAINSPNPAQQGYSVSLSGNGNTLAAGGYTDNSFLGATWIFVRSGSTWTQQGTKLVGSGTSGSSRQGCSVSLSADGNSLATGGYNDATAFGATWIFV
jgi:hypothetical protein